MKYQVIYADPPWRFGSKSYQDGNRDMSKLESVYATMSTADIKALPVKDISETNAACFMWVTDSHLKEGIETMEAWGFKYKTVAFVWVKKTNIGNTACNFAPWTLKSTEICLLGIKGAMSQFKTSNNVRQLIEAERTAHSRKPDEARRRIEALFAGGAKLEMFARQQSQGWDAFGNEVENSITIQ
jgi:N6-adenosine-specific RNA methylase IME4